LVVLCNQWEKFRAAYKAGKKGEHATYYEVPLLDYFNLEKL